MARPALVYDNPTMRSFGPPHPRIKPHPTHSNPQWIPGNWIARNLSKRERPARPPGKGEDVRVIRPDRDMRQFVVPSCLGDVAR